MIENNKLPLIVIVGPTASGKTSLAIDLAKKYNGEIICADSRTIYKGMDIGTAKPSRDEQSIVAHHGLDIVKPNEYFSASDFKKYADTKIIEIRQRGHIPFLVGGSGLYVDSVIFNYKFGSKSNSKMRIVLSNLSIPKLHELYNDKGIELPENKLNKRYLIRGIERSNDNKQIDRKLIDNVYVVGISTEKLVLESRISARIERMFVDKVLDEARFLISKYGQDCEAMTGNIYRLSSDYFDNKISKNEMIEKLNTLDRRLAKKQMTWFKRNKFIHWGSSQELTVYINKLLEN